MSVTDLFLWAAADTKVEEIAEFLCVPIVTLNEHGQPFPGCDGELKVGPITIRYTMETAEAIHAGDVYKPRNGRTWVLSFRFEMDRKLWGNFQLLLAMEICGFMYANAGGAYFAMLDTGEPMFIVDDHGFFVQEDWRNLGYPYPARLGLPTYCRPEALR